MESDTSDGGRDCGESTSYELFGRDRPHAAVRRHIPLRFKAAIGFFRLQDCYRAGNVASIRSALHWPVRSFVDGSRTRVELALDQFREVA